MKKEYVLTISVRDAEHPLRDEVLIEMGFNPGNPMGMARAVEQIGQLLGMLGSPEKVAGYMRDNMAIPGAQPLLLKRG